MHAELIVVRAEPCDRHGARVRLYATRCRECGRFPPRDRHVRSPAIKRVIRRLRKSISNQSLLHDRTTQTSARLALSLLCRTFLSSKRQLLFSNKSSKMSLSVHHTGASRISRTTARITSIFTVSNTLPSLYPMSRDSFERWLYKRQSSGPRCRIT